MKGIILFYLFLLLASSDTHAQADSLSSLKDTIAADSLPLTVVEQMPEFPGGTEELYKFLKGHIKYPRSAKRAGKEGVVYIGFIVGKDGFIREIKLIRGVPDAPELDKAAMNIIAKMPRWKPGMQNGKVVNVKYTLPIKFSLLRKL